MVRRVPPITSLPADPWTVAQPVEATRMRYCLALMLKGIKAGGIPAAAGWDVQPRRGREAW